MGIKINGFICDNCRVFSSFESVSIEHLSDLNTENDLVNVKYKKTKEWVYYNVMEFDNDYIQYIHGSKCYCSNCSRVLKINKIIRKNEGL